MARVMFILDNSVKHLKQSFSEGASKTTVDCGLQPHAPDEDVIDLAFRERAILVTADAKFEGKCRKFQSKRNRCLRGLLLLPDGREQQERVLLDIRQGRRIMCHAHFKISPTWEDIRKENLFVNARISGQLQLKDLCACEWEDDES